MAYGDRFTLWWKAKLLNEQCLPIAEKLAGLPWHCSFYLLFKRPHAGPLNMALKFEAVCEHTGSMHKLCAVLQAGRDYKMEKEWYYKKPS